MENLAQYIEHTYLKPDFSEKILFQLITEAETFGFKGICIPPFWVKKAAREIAQKPIELVTVVGFPLGYTMTETKLEETRLALQDGATEIDMVINISAYLSEMNWTKIEIAKIASLVHSKEKLLKVIIETAYLSNSQIVDLCNICAEAGADFVKTSTGFAPEGAKVEHITLMRSNLPSSVSIKASGGIKTTEQALNLIKAGADRIGTSSGPVLVKL